MEWWREGLMLRAAEGQQPIGSDLCRSARARQQLMMARFDYSKRRPSAHEFASQPASSPPSQTRSMGPT